MRVLHVIDNFNIGGIQELIFNLYKYSQFKHDGRGYPGSLSPEMEAHGFDLNTGRWDYDVLVGHTVGGWSYDDTFREAKEHGLKTVEVMHSPAHSPTNPSLVDGFIGLNYTATEMNAQMLKRTTIYAIANNVHPVSGKGDYIGRVSRVVPEKRPDVFAHIARNMPQSKFLLGGDGNMLSYIQSAQVSNLEFTGMVRDFQNFLERLKMFVFPTKDECCSMSVAMGQSAGLPCVVQDIPPLRETTGQFVEFADGIDTFVSKVAYLLDHPSFARELGQAGRFWAEHHFTPAVVCRQWEEFLEAL